MGRPLLICRRSVASAGAASRVMRCHVPFGDDLDGAVDHRDRRLVVDGVRRSGMPAAHCSASAMVLPGMPSAARCGQIEKSTRPSVRVVAARWPPLDEVVPDLGGHHHAPRAEPHPDRLAQRRQQVCQPGLAASSGTGRGRPRPRRAGRRPPGPAAPNAPRRCWAARSAPARRRTSSPGRPWGSRSCR